MRLRKSTKLALTLKAYEEMTESPHSLLTSLTDGVERSAECSYSPREIGGKAGPRADLDSFEKIESTCPSLHRTKIPQNSTP
jgi:hypothetical protein